MIEEPGREQIVWLNGAFVRWSDAVVHVSAHHYGMGVFEGVRAYATAKGCAAFRLRDHTARLFRSAHMLRIPLPERFSQAELDEVQLELLRRNRLADAYLRPFVFYGGSSGLSRDVRNLSVNVAVMALPWGDLGAYGNRETTKRGLSLRTSSFRRNPSASLLSKAKANGNYVNGILALQEAQSCGADEALLLDQNGFVTETSGSNLFAVINGVLHTPPAESVLEGITRDTVLTLAAWLGYQVVEKAMPREDFYVADEVFLTGTAAEVTFVRELDGRKIGSGSIGPVTGRLRETYAALVRGRGECASEWLSSP